MEKTTRGLFSLNITTHRYGVPFHERAIASKKIQLCRYK
jgi:hypothetical protein